MRITNKTNFIGYEGESNSREISFEIPEKIKDCDIYLVGTKPDGSGFMSEKLDIDSTYMIPAILLDTPGYLQARLEAYRKNNFIMKSATRTFYVAESPNVINAILAETKQPDLVTQLLSRIADLEARVSELENNN